MTGIKLCGMMQPKDVIAACELGADYIGFVLSDGFRRSVGLGTFCELAGYADDYSAGIKKVGVFVNEPIEGITQYYAEMLDLIQLHGKEDDAYIGLVRELTGRKVIKAFMQQRNKDIRIRKFQDGIYAVFHQLAHFGKKAQTNDR